MKSGMSDERLSSTLRMMAQQSRKEEKSSSSTTTLPRALHRQPRRVQRQQARRSLKRGARARAKVTTTCCLGPKQCPRRRKLHRLRSQEILREPELRRQRAGTRGGGTPGKEKKPNTALRERDGCQGTAGPAPRREESPTTQEPQRPTAKGNTQPGQGLRESCGPSTEKGRGMDHQLDPRLITASTE